MSTLWLVPVVLYVGLCSIITNSVVAIDDGSKKCDFSAIFNFGDSNSDTGGLSAAFGQPGPPFGESFFHHPVGRYCDGRLIIDFIGTIYILSFIILHTQLLCIIYFSLCQSMY